ncbi:MAG: hypothetical protein WKF97_24940 [Chitinophagaceae bacterium]
MKKVIFSIAIILSGLISLKAQTSATASQTVTLILKNAISINITSATGTNFTFNNSDEYLNGETNASATTLQVQSNRPWAVTVKTTSANFSGPAAPAAPMPSSVLGVRLNGGTTFAALSTTATALTSGERGNASFSVDYKATPGFTYDAGTYAISVVYTATQQ